MTYQLHSKLGYVKAPLNCFIAFSYTSNHIVDTSIKEFVVVHNGIVTNYKDIKQFLVSGIETESW